MDWIPWLTQLHYLSDLLTMTDPQNQEAYQKLLQKSLEEIEDYLAKTEESAEAVSPDKSLGRLSRMEAMQDQQLILEARRRKKIQKVAVLSALQRIENGQFGICIFCGKPIASQRLEVAPESSACVSCSWFLAMSIRFLYYLVGIEPGSDCSQVLVTSNTINQISHSKRSIGQSVNQ